MATQAEKVTILDIAKKANVSASTVSRVLRGTARVSQSKRDVVMKVVAELNYQPNIFAQSLVSGQSMTIGVITQNFGSPFFDGILRGILQQLEPSAYSAIFADGRWQPDVEQQAIKMLMERQVDGLILVGGLVDDDLLGEIAEQKPLILVARQSHALANRCIRVDNFQGAYTATQYLIEQGHRQIAHITTPETSRIAADDVTQRLAGFKQALSDTGIEPDPQLIMEGNLLQQSGVLAVEWLLMGKRPFSAIFCANDQMAFGARLALFRRGLRVPEDVSLVGFDDHYSAAYAIPPLTTVRQPAIELGHAAVAAIFDLLKEKTPTIPLFAPQLIIRESVALLR